MGEAMSGLDLGQMIAHGFAQLTGAQRDAGETYPVAATETGSVVLPDGTEMLRAKSGSIGLGVTPSAWNSDYKVHQVGSTASFYGRVATPVAGVANNAYRDAPGNWLYQTTGVPAVRYEQDTGAHIWYTAPSGTAGNPISFTQAMTLDAAGNLGIGVSPIAGLGKAQVAGNICAGRIGIPVHIQDTDDTNYGNAIYIPYDDGSSTQRAFRIRSSYSTFALHFEPSTNTQANFTDPATLTYGTGFTLDTAGNLLVGATSAYGVGMTLKPSGEFSSTVSGTGATHNLFINSNGIVGSITTSGPATFYNTSSDTRLKENIAAADNGSALIDQLQVRKFDWKADGSHQRYGFVAQEIDAVFPEAVSKPADPEQMMGVDYSKLVPLLVQEVQSLRARLAALEAA